VRQVLITAVALLLLVVIFVLYFTPNIEIFEDGSAVIVLHNPWR
jgi:type II secretory pathway component PulM